MEASSLFYNLFFLGAIISVVVYCYSTWSKFGRDETMPVPSAQYEVPENLTPSTLSAFFKHSYVTFSALISIVSLYMKGYVSTQIISIPTGPKNTPRKVREFTKEKEPDNSLPAEDKQLMNDIFETEDTFIFNSYNQNLSVHSYAHLKSVDAINQQYPIEHNFKKALTPILALITVIITGFLNISRFEQVTVGALIWILATQLLFGVIIYNMNRNEKSNQAFGTGETIVLVISGISALFFWCFTGVSEKILTEFSLSSIDVSLTLFAIVLFVFGSGMGVFLKLLKKPSTQWLELKARIEGYKMYLAHTKSGTDSTSNKPEIQYGKLYPYALALGLTKKGAVDIKDIDFEALSTL